MSENISFFRNEDLICPACKGKVKIEVLRQGGGRLNSISLGNDLRRIYASSKKFGSVYPLLYSLYVCGKCWFAALKEDFNPKAFDFKLINEFSSKRKLHAQTLVKNYPLDFNQYRNLYTGFISYYLATHCYNFYNQDAAIEFYKGLFSLRASWCAQDLSDSEEDEDYKITSLHFRYLAALSYENYISYVESKTIDRGITFFGPDTDHDFEYKGAAYLSALLGQEFSELIVNEHDRYKFISKIMRRLSRVFGIGKKTKSSPTPFLDKVYDLFKEIKTQNEKLKTELNIPDPIEKFDDF